MLSPDFFPLAAGLRHEYRVSDAGGEGRLFIEVVDVSGKGPHLRARCRRTFSRGGTEESSDFTVTRDAAGVVLAGELCLKLPLRPGGRWSSPPRDYTAESTDEMVVVPGGVFSGCARVVYTIGGGDGGGGERWYAPDVGLVREVCQAEDEGFEWQLLGFRAP